MSEELIDPAKALIQPTGSQIVEHEHDSPEARAKIDALLGVMLGLDQAEVQISHFFAKGVYARQGLIKKGTVIVGHYKKFSHINIISSGDISIYTEEGEKRITGSCVMVAAPGTRRVGFAHEDTIWTSIVGTDETEVEKVEEQIIAKTYEDYLEHCKSINGKGLPCLE